MSHPYNSFLGSPNGDSTTAAISSDGRYVTFVSSASNLVNGLTVSGGKHNVFLYEVTTANVTLVSHSSSSFTASNGLDSGSPTISADGGVVAYESGGNVY